MVKTHVIPAMYNPDIPYNIKCEVMLSLCQTMAKHKGMTLNELGDFIIEKLNVDIKKLDSNPVGMLLLYEYLYSQRPQACQEEAEKRRH